MDGAFRVEVTETFAAAHHLRGIEGPCARVHGHNWRVRVAVCVPDLDEHDLSIDFLRLREAVRDVLDRWEHRDLNEIPPFDERTNPSAEAVAAELARHLANRLPSLPAPPGSRLHSVTIWEMESFRVTYHPRNRETAGGGPQ